MDVAGPLGRLCSGPWSPSNAEPRLPSNAEPGISGVPSFATNEKDGEMRVAKTHKVTDTMIRDAIAALTDRRGSSVNEIHSWLRSKIGDDVSDKDVRLALRRGLRDEKVASGVRGRFLWFGQKPDCDADDKKVGRKASSSSAGGKRASRVARGQSVKSASKKAAVKCDGPKGAKGAKGKKPPKKGGSGKSAKGGKAKGCPGGKKLVTFCASASGGGGFFGRNMKGKSGKKGGKKTGKKAGKKGGKKAGKKAGKSAKSKKDSPPKKSPKTEAPAPASTFWFGCGRKTEEVKDGQDAPQEAN